MKNTYSADQAPAIFGADRGMDVTPVESLETLKNVGGNFDGNSAMLNDEWSFPDLNTLMANKWIKRQLTRRGGQNSTTLICGERTRGASTKLAWFNVGSLSRQDNNREYVQPEWADLGNDYARIENLAGRTFKVTETKTVDMPKWEDGVRIEGESIQKAIPLVPFK